jgi:hypothetical protein
MPLLWLQYSGFLQLSEIDDSFMIDSPLFGKYDAIALATNVVYYYLGSCLVVYMWKKIRSAPQPASASIRQ